ncbi:LysE family translocator [Streptomyces cellulosae]|uniref:LysE family translocator n=2 Tax=Streptomyces TaxID=1883 RepID=A0ABU3J446_9ACTN|nr:LysE family translocator [Streptomyces sp. McG7]MBT2907090.1 LysE family translocator [Streptomyces sp. McG8]MCX4478504.1 LysE family translocator [Streptomyces cellulosae]MDQ0487930.1 threonine/homoserine/homoserine lactone efflux protein [Streptomyces thermodiastaticus]MDT6969826.1 LysE family translocator [Streptomyces thermocarboxydus]MXQ59409.1 LysE family transporter [Streptomyces sp. XHT-2]MYQ30818.1 LysE family transporter [Streptomyces sp. SID4956]MYW51736.1 LysE family transport
MSLAFLLAALAVVVTPGTGVVYTLAAGLSHGRRAGLVAAFGCTVAVVPHLLASVTGLAALLASSPLAYAVVKYAGAAYLLYMAWAMLRDKEAFTVRPEPEPEPRPALRVITTAVLINVLNPKPMLFFVAFLPQFVPAGSSGSLGLMLQLGGVFMALTFVVFTAYGVCAAAVRDRLLAHPRVTTALRAVFTASFVGLSARMAVA